MSSKTSREARPSESQQEEPSGPTGSVEPHVMDEFMAQLKDLVESKPPYIYEPLPRTGKFIRLLEMIPDDGTRLIKCRLVARELTPDLKYDAISYCWNSGGQHETGERFPIECEGKRLYVNVGLAELLAQMPPSLQTGLMWVDGACINQEDVADRAYHVNHVFADIYANAARVIVWLGSDEKGFAPDAMKIIYETVTFHNQALIAGASGAEIPLPPASVKAAMDDNSLWKPVQEFFLLDWHKRVWVQQEIGLAKKCIAVWGQSGMEWDFVVEFSFIQQTAADLRYPDHGAAAFNLSMRFLDIWCQFEESGPSYKNRYPVTRRFHGLEKSSPADMVVSSGRILRLLNTVRDLRCTDQRDRIFAFLSHPFMRIALNTNEVLMEADYESSIEDVYTKAAREMVSRMNSLMLLSAVVHKQDPSQSALPSWVPRWDDGGTSICLGLIFPGREIYYNASKPRNEEQVRRLASITSLHSVADRVLKVRGVILDRVSGISSVTKANDWDKETTTGAAIAASSTTTNESSVPFTNPTETIWRDLVSPLSNSASPYRHLALAFACALAAGLFSGGVPAEDRASLLYNSFRAYVLSRCKLSQDELQRLGLTHEEPMILGPMNRDRTLEIQFSWGMGVANRRFFATTKGYMGGGPSVMQEDDLCCVLFGARVPLILRPTEKKGQYRLIGEAFIQGVMRGEALDMLEKGELEEEVFEIV